MNIWYGNEELFEKLKMNLTTLKTEWQDTPEYHQHIHELFTDLVNKYQQLKAHRDYIEQNVWGFGERSFWWLWKLICDELPEDANLLEIGVFRGATLSLWRLLKPKAGIIGVTPLDTSGGVWQSDYKDDIKKIHGDFGLSMPVLFVGDSHNVHIVDDAYRKKPYDVIYIDGDHSYEGALSDLNNYAPMVKIGGFLVIDDCCCDMNMPWGYFQGISDVNAAFDAWDKIGFEFVTNCVHLRVLKRIS